MHLSNIIIFGSNTLNTLGLLRSIGEKGIKIDLLLEPCCLEFCCLRFSKYIRKIHYLLNVQEGLKILLDEYRKENEKQIVINASDSSICLLDAHYDELKEYFYIFNAKAKQNRINFFMDKTNQFIVAEACGLKQIKTWKVNSDSDLPKDIIFPCLIKGSNSIKSTKKDMYICNSIEELKDSLNKTTEFLIQEYINRDFELNINGISFYHGNTQYIPAVIYKIRDSLARQGEFLRVDDSAIYPDKIINGIKELVKEIGYEGLYSVELLKRSDDYFFLEINMRSDGLGYAYTAAGVNYPYMWIQYILGNLDIEMLNKKAHTPIYVMIEHDIHNIWEHNISVFQWIKDLLRTDSFLVFNKKDIKPYLYTLYIIMRQAYRKFFLYIKKKSKNNN